MKAAQRAVRDAERRLPVKVRIAVPLGGLGSRFDQIIAWLDGIVHLPDEALTANKEARDRIIKSIITDHWHENNGRVPAYGGITGYILVLVAGYGGLDFGSPFTSRAIEPVECRRSSD